MYKSLRNDDQKCVHVGVSFHHYEWPRPYCATLTSADKLYNTMFTALLLMFPASF